MYTMDGIGISNFPGLQFTPIIFTRPNRACLQIEQERFDELRNTQHQSDSACRPVNSPLYLKAVQMLLSYGYVCLLCRADPSLNDECDYTNSNPIACMISHVNLTRYFLGNTRKALRCKGGADQCGRCHGRTWGVDQARAIYGRRSDTRPAGTRREDIGDTGVRRVGGGSRSLRPHGEQ